ncbi:M23 family metallopeptidase [Sphingomonas baiyangensis]|uniref:M23 family metallopeptidase n=1 Tax=Sphingomonas baiyangensis TaxID=2572576 RepID=A0A4V5PTP1_9SPHN|nr:M23 family metallopeptidase [Sphingomonas baiyangensis]TKD50848.1 M23 family metallopeptidase [Sphingomonas baiyangensis]
MTRLGWGILLLIVVAGLLFASMLRFGGEGSTITPPIRAAHDTVPEPSIPDRIAPPPPGRVAWGRGLLAVPVAGVSRADIASSWGDPRGEGRVHRGADIMAPAGTSVLAAAEGVVEKRYFSEGGGGIALYIRSPDMRWSYYYAHLSDYAPGIAEGVRVRAGQPIGFVGATGNASPDAPHLHFGMHVMQAGERWWQGRAVDPTPLLAGPGAGR